MIVSSVLLCNRFITTININAMFFFRMKECKAAEYKVVANQKKEKVLQKWFA